MNHVRPAVLNWTLLFAIGFVACLIIWLGAHYAIQRHVQQYSFTGTVSPSSGRLLS